MSETGDKQKTKKKRRRSYTWEELTAMKRRAWIFTLNGSQEEIESFVIPESVTFPREKSAPAVTYCKYAHEIGEHGNHHIQGYVVFDIRQRVSAVSTICGFRKPHVEPREGTHEQAKEYAGASDKSGQVINVVELGSDVSLRTGFRTVSRRSDESLFSEIRALVDNGAEEFELWQRYGAFMCRNFRGVREYIKLIQLRGGIPYGVRDE